MAAAPAAMLERRRGRIGGTVQGVGFRPYLYRLASELGLAGWVLNDVAGVVVEVEGEPDGVRAFFERLPAEAPPLAEIGSLATEPVAVTGESGFTIRASPAAGEPRAAVTPDGATCDDCLRELFDPASRRYRYPFTNCTNCGPRFTIVRAVPYDRPNTTMSGFGMCAACRAEYEDPADRRFHAQPNACPECGPHVRLVAGVDRRTNSRGGFASGRHAVDPVDPVAAAARALLGGAIVAVKGIGGFHLACRADDDSVVSTLRERKHREDKPFALMAPDLAAVRALVTATPEDEALLRSAARPIVLMSRRADAAVAPAVAPLARELGVMLPYSPLHHLLLRDCAVPLVMTSGNVCDEPIAYRDDDALDRLARIADLFLLHDRLIETRTDDSVARTIAVGGEARRRPLTLRRSRGYVPDALRLPIPARRPLLACGTELKNTFCLAKRDQAWAGHHVGDLENWETLRSFTTGIAHFERLFAVAPELVAHDLHPEYLSTKYALEREGVDLLAIQHHHAHLAACLAEHGEKGPAVGAIYDGTGYGTDGTIWGGELLVGDLHGFERGGHLLPVRMPGGDSAIRQPWRMACSWLEAASVDAPPVLARRVEPARWQQVVQLASRASAPMTSSAGRLFDAVAAICGIRTEINYEGQAAIELEALADPREPGAYPFELAGSESLVLDPRAAVAELAAAIAAGTSTSVAAARFHNGLADATAAACAELAAGHGCASVVLSGGVFQNVRLLARTGERLAERGLRVLVPRRLPPGDGGISFGQAAIAAARG